MLNLWGVFFALVAIILHAWANIFDNYFSSKIFKRLTNLIFFSALVNLLFLPIVLLIDFPKALSFHSLEIIFLISLIDVLYAYPYYWSLRRLDTSVVTSLFSLGKVFTPLFAFFLVREELTLVQYVGFFLVVFSSFLLPLDARRFRLDKAFFYMLLVSILLTLQGVLYKYVFEQGTSWGTAITWTTCLALVIALMPVLHASNRKDFISSTKKVKKLGWLFLLNQGLSWGGEATYTMAIFLMPASIVKGITSTQPIFVLLFAFLFAKDAKYMFREHLGSGALMKKLILFLLVIFGTILIAVG